MVRIEDDTNNDSHESKINNDFLSQSYCQGIERITGTRENIFDFKVPKEVLKVRKKTWDKFFDKYSKKISDEIELNINTLEPDDEISEEENQLRLPMCKSPSLVQYWVNTGNPPCKVLLDQSNLSDTGSSLSEKEICLPLCHTFPIEINKNYKQQRSDSSCSSVDTAAYILSNANITKKADTIAIIEGGKLVDVNSSKDASVKNKVAETVTIAYNNRIIHNNFVGSVRADHIHNNLTSASTVKSNAFSHNLSFDEADKMDTLSSQRGISVRSINDIVSIFRQFDKTSKRLSKGCKNDNDLSQHHVSEEHLFDSEQNRFTVTTKRTVTKDTDSLSSHHKKLYTGRNSPMDLILVERRSTSKPSKAKPNLHPALDPDGGIKTKVSPKDHKGKDKQPFLFSKKNLRKVQKKEKENQKKGRKKCSFGTFSVSNENIMNIRDEVEVTSQRSINGKDGIEDFVIDDFRRCSLDCHDSSYRPDDNVPIEQYNEMSVSLKNKSRRQDLISLNLNPVVLLERIAPSFEQYKSKSIESCSTTRESNMSIRHLERHMNTSKKSNASKIEYLAVESIDSDVSTILICKCKKTAPGHLSSSSSCSLQFRLNIEDDNFSTLNTEKKSSKSVKVENVDTSHYKKACIVLERLSESVIKNYTSATKSQVLNVHGTPPIRHDGEALNKSKMHSNLHGIDKNDNINFRECRTVLKRLPADVYYKRGTTKGSIPVEKISQCTNLHDDKEKFETSVHESIKTLIKTINKSDTDLSRINVKSKNKIPDKVESNSASRYKNYNSHDNDKESSSKCNKYSVLNLSSSDDEFVGSIQPLKKRSRVTTVDEASGESNLRNDKEKLKTSFRRSIKSLVQTIRKTGTNSEMYVKSKKKISSKIESNSASRYKNYDSHDTDKESRDKCNEYSVLNLSSSNDEFVELDLLQSLRKKQLRVSAGNKTFGETSKKQLKRSSRSGACVVLFQTKIIDTDSSASEGSDNYIVTSKSLRNSRHNSRYHNHVDKKEFSNGSIAKKYMRKEINSLNSSVGKRTVTKRARSVRNESGLVRDEETEENERLDENINSNVNDTNEYVTCSSTVNSKRKKKNGSYLNTSVENNNYDRSFENHQMVAKSTVTSSLSTQQHSITTKSLTFQTKTYYDSDTSELF